MNEPQIRISHRKDGEEFVSVGNFGGFVPAIGDYIPAGGLAESDAGPSTVLEVVGRMVDSTGVTLIVKERDLALQEHTLAPAG